MKISLAETLNRRISHGECHHHEPHRSYLNLRSYPPNVSNLLTRLFARLIRFFPLLLFGVSFAFANETRDFVLPKGDAAETLKLFATQASREILYSSKHVAGVTTNAVSGKYTPRASLDLMVAGTGLVVIEDRETGALMVNRPVRRGQAPAPLVSTPPKPDKQPSMNRKTPIAIIAAWLALLTSPAPAQSTAAPASTDPAKSKKHKPEETVVLSPFVVKTEKDTGYQTTSTLAGTRLNTPLKDIAASISVLTKDLFEDTASSKSVDVLVYALSTEVAGVGGNYSGGSAVAERQSPIPANRIRGLAQADNTRNFFSTKIPMDAYNTDSVTINRGANAILFGLGSPAGIIETSTISAQFRDGNKVQLRTDNYGTTRESLDFERVLLDHKLSLRIAALNEDQRYEQQEAFLKQKRITGAIAYKPFRDTTVRVSMEQGRNKQRLPRIQPPGDTIQAWWTYGKLTRPNNLWLPPYGSLDGAEEQFQRYNALDGAFGPFFYSPAVFFPNSGGAPTDSFPSFSDPFVNAAHPNPDPALLNRQYRFLGIRDPNGNLYYSTKDPSVPGNVLAFFNHNPQILDRSAFDYRKHMIDGPNSHTMLNFRAVNATVEQLFLEGAAGIELAYDKQHATTEQLNTDPGAVSIDVNVQTIDGRANPNFGRPYIAMGRGAHRDIDDSENVRATAFLKHDFSGSWGWLGRVLGHQQLTGFYTDWNHKDFSMDAAAAVFSSDYFIQGSHHLGNRSITPVVYLGGSLLGAASLAGANLSPIKAPLTYPQTMTTQSLNGTEWEGFSNSVYQYPDWRHIVNGSSVSKVRSSVVSHGEVWQGRWLDDLLVSTLGWRSDEVKNYTGSNADDATLDVHNINEPHTTLAQTAKSNLFSQGYVLHTPEKMRKWLPFGIVPSLYLNKSENFQVTGFRQNIYAEAIGPQSGNTKEWGVGVEAFDGKLNFRITKFKTVQANQSDDRVTGLLSLVGALEQRIYETNTQATLDAAGYVSFSSANAGPLLKRYAGVWQMKDIGAHPNGIGRSIQLLAPIGVSETTSSVSEGWEYDVVYNPTRNWRMMLNASEATAARGPAAEVFGALVNEQKQYWLKNSVKGLPAGQNYTVGDFAQAVIINNLNTALLSVGQLNPELRKWRANFITNYKFPRASKFKGWDVGGAVRWEDKIAIGYAVINDPLLGTLSDPRKPFFGPSETTVDLETGYTRPIFNKKVDWKIQLNVKNALNDNLLIPLQSNAVAVGETKNFTVGTYRIGAERSFVLTSSFLF